MLNRTILAASAALVIALSAPIASAYSIVSSKVVQGTIKSVDAENYAITLESSSGREQILDIQESAKIYLDGNKTQLSSLVEGQKVRIDHKTYTPVSNTIEGEIVSVNSKKNTARIRTEENRVVVVRFDETPTVKGDIKNGSLASLRKGHQVVLRYSN